MRYVKTGWHVLAAVAALVEYRMSTTLQRKLLCGGAAGYHIAAAHQDWRDK